MGLLSQIPAGPCLSKPEGFVTRNTETYEGLKARLLEGLLPAQREFVEDTDHLILGLCAGFGAGKTRALCCKVVMLSMENPGKVGAVFEPTHILLRDVWMRSFDEFLEEYEIPFSFRVSPQPEYIL